MAVFIAMLRGINVGGQNRMRMEDLRSSLDSLGYSNTETYVQSGNVVFNSVVSDNEDVLRQIREKILKDYGFSVAVIVRNSAQMAKIVRANPYLEERGIDPSKLHVTFLSAHPAKALLSRMDRLREAPDRFHVAGREVYLHCPNGYGRTKLSNNAIEKALTVQATTRNWKTVSTLEKMSSGKQ